MDHATNSRNFTTSTWPRFRNDRLWFRELMSCPELLKRPGANNYRPGWYWKVGLKGSGWFMIYNDPAPANIHQGSENETLHKWTKSIWKASERKWLLWRLWETETQIQLDWCDKCTWALVGRKRLMKSLKQSALIIIGYMYFRWNTFTKLWLESRASWVMDLGTFQWENEAIITVVQVKCFCRSRWQSNYKQL